MKRLLVATAWACVALFAAGPAFASLGTWNLFYRAAKMAMDRRDYSQAEGLYESSMDALKDVPEPGYPQMVASLVGLAEARQDQGDGAGLDGIYRRCLSITARAKAPYADVNGMLYEAMAHHAYLEGDLVSARAYAMKSLYNLGFGGEDVPAIAASVHIQLLDIARRQGKWVEAEQWLGKALGDVRGTRGDLVPSMILVWENALIFCLDRHLDARLPLCIHQLGIFESQTTRPGEPPEAWDARLIARACDHQGRRELAAKYWEQAGSEWEKRYGPRDTGALELLYRGLRDKETKQ